MNIPIYSKLLCIIKTETEIWLTVSSVSLEHSKKFWKPESSSCSFRDPFQKKPQLGHPLQDHFVVPHYKNNDWIYASLWEVFTENNRKSNWLLFNSLKPFLDIIYGVFYISCLRLDSIALEILPFRLLSSNKTLNSSIHRFIYDIYY